MPARMVQTRNRFEGIWQWDPFIGRLDVVVAVLVDGAVAVENDEFGLHGWASTLRSECGQVGHAVHGFMQFLQHALAIQTQVHLFGVDHDVVKERIHRRTQRR